MRVPSLPRGQRAAWPFLGKDSVLGAAVPCLVATVPIPSAYAEPSDAKSLGESSRPKIGLVVSGWGARGMAHVGVLKVLEELRVPAHYIVGTSRGSIVAGACSVGLSPEELQRFSRASPACSGW